jgi:hypothetical protein
MADHTTGRTSANGFGGSMVALEFEKVAIAHGRSRHESGKKQDNQENACPDARGTFGDLPLSLASSMSLVPVREFHYFLAWHVGDINIQPFMP